MTGGHIKGAVSVLLFISILHVVQAQTQQTNTPNAVQENQRLTDARRANEEAQAAFYREQVAKLREPSKPQTFWQNVGGNPASLLGLLGGLFAALVTLFSFYKNQRLTISNQNDAQFYEALKRFGEKDSARLRSSAVGLLTAMAHPNVSKGWFRQVNKSGDKFSTVLAQLVAGSRLEENRVVLNSIRDAMGVLGGIEPYDVIDVLYKANLNLQDDLKIAIQNISFHFMEKDAHETDEYESYVGPKISDKLWKPLEQVTGFNSHLLYDWFGNVTANFSDYNSSALAEVNAMTAEEKSRHKRTALEQVKITSYQLRQNVEACCVTLFHVAKRVKDSNENTSSNYLSRNFTKRSVLPRSKPPLKLNKIFLASGNLSRLDLSSLKGATLGLQETFLYEVNLADARLIRADLSKARLIGANLSKARLMGSDLSEVTLEGANLEGANLEGADLSNASLLNAQLWHARVDQESILLGVQWWTANFFDTNKLITPGSTLNGTAGQALEIDSSLIAELFRRYKPDDLTIAHKSVRQYKDGQRQQFE
jgi:uncharacterized protein YjbI with pentapeptide repeats